MVINRIAVVAAAALLLWAGVEPAQADFSDSWTEGYGQLIHRYVFPGARNGISGNLVDYKGLREDPRFKKLRRGLARLPSFSTLPKRKRLALWLNIYNFLVISLVVDHPGLKNLLEIRKGEKTVWHLPAGEVAGKTHSLHGIDRVILRFRFKDPRVHFALTKGMVSSPDLRREPYQADKLDVQLREQMKSFLGNPGKGKRVERTGAGGVLHLSTLFDWFKRDFGNNPRAWLLNRQLISPDDARLSPPLRFLTFDFTLNARPDGN